MSNDEFKAEVIAVYPNKVKITVDKLEDFQIAEEKLKVGSYLKISDSEDSKLFAIIENFSIVVDESGRKYMIEANPIGMLSNGKFVRGGDSIAIPPKCVEPATAAEIQKIYEESVEEKLKFTFSTLLSRSEIEVPVNGDRFFNKHVAIVGSTGSGKSHSVAMILQKATSEKSGKFSLNNSHVVIFDIHSEYKSAFPNANHINIDNLNLPYWLLNSEELEEVLLDTGERDNYNQASIFRTLVTENKKRHNQSLSRIFYDTPVYFDILEVQRALKNFKDETVNAKNSARVMIVDPSYTLSESKTDEKSGIELIDEKRLYYYFDNDVKFHPTKAQNITKGDWADGTLDKFYARFSAKIQQDRLAFLFGDTAKNETFESTLSTLMGYKNKSNVTVIDLSGVPFEVLSITVSLISRLIFEYDYIYKRLRSKTNPLDNRNNDIPILLVYEEAHKYVPNSDLSKFRASKNSIERIAKEGRKYGVTLLLASQRPSEISETIFSQCNNFVVMRLTNPNDQAYVKKLLPDTLGNLIEVLPTLKSGDALLIGESVALPSIVHINQCNPQPSSIDIPFYELWKEEWKDLKFDEIKDEWHK